MLPYPYNVPRPGALPPHPIPRPIRWPKKKGKGEDPDWDPGNFPGDNPEATPKPDPIVEPTRRIKIRPKPRDDKKAKPRHKPGRKVKEKKVMVHSMTVMRRILGNLLSAYSEFGDIVDALYAGVPKEYRTWNADTAQKIRDMYAAGDKYNFLEGLRELHANEAEDRVWGRAFGHAADMLDDYGVQLPFLQDGYAYIIR